MIKIDYVFNSKSPIHTGSDKNSGTMKEFRRQKIAVQPYDVKAFFSKENRIKAIARIIAAVYKAVPKAGMSQNRLFGLWEEMQSKILAAATSRDRHLWFSRLCDSWGVKDLFAEKILEWLDAMGDNELLTTVRKMTTYLILKAKEFHKASSFGGDTDTFNPSLTEETYRLYIEEIPCISGNSIRGALRDLAMHDFVERTGIKSLDLETYFSLFSGGRLGGENPYELIDKRLEYMNMCPMLSIFGAAMGNMTLDGTLFVGFAWPCCKELGTGEQSYWEFLDIIFQTRQDDSKTEEKITLSKKEGEVIQMKYEYEVIAQGTPFSHSFRFRDTGDEISKSAFIRVLELFKENPFIGGRFASGNAEIDLSSLEIPGSSNVYLKYLEVNKEKIKEYFESLRLPKKDKEAKKGKKGKPGDVVDAEFPGEGE